MAYKMEQILAQFMERKMDLPVLGAKLSFRGAKVCTGSARLFFSSDHFRSNVFGKLWMKAHVHSLRESLKSNDFVLTGRTTDGWKVKVYALQCPYNAAKSEGEDVEIAFTPDLVVVRPPESGHMNFYDASVRDQYSSSTSAGVL